ncbi:MAG: hypothetical protein KatS3mg054_0222 [Chloroflexus sp.]|nr:MAG: hypothetical protein KatS3mg054_0222 [Chloroflexus sp.]
MESNADRCSCCSCYLSAIITASSPPSSPPSSHTQLPAQSSAQGQTLPAPTFGVPTLPVPAYGLCTVVMTVPVYVWVEVLTHRRFARNAASARAMRDVTSLGYYHPPTFYHRGRQMQSGSPITDERTSAALHHTWDAYHHRVSLMVGELERLSGDEGLANEQKNRLYPTTRMIRGVVTGTVSAWQAFLALRDHPTADTAMQHLAARIRGALMSARWHEDTVHAPMVEYGDVRAAVAAIARVSYDRFVPEQRTVDGMQRLINLFTRLAAEKHYSPFEHIAVWSDNAPIGPFACQPDDVYLANNLANSEHHTTRQHDYWYRRPFAAWVSYRALIDGTYPNPELEQQIIRSYVEVQHDDYHDLPAGA